MASTPTQVKMDIKETKNARKSSTSYSFDFIKEKIKEKTMKSLDCDVLPTFCAKLHFKTSGTKETLMEGLSPLKDEALFENRIIASSIRSFSLKHLYHEQMFPQLQRAGSLTLHYSQRSDKLT